MFALDYLNKICMYVCISIHNRLYLALRITLLENQHKTSTEVEAMAQVLKESCQRTSIDSCQKMIKINKQQTYKTCKLNNLTLL